MAEQIITRKINVGRITGLSSYELAVKYGFRGTEEEYVKKETEMFEAMKQLATTMPGFNQITCGEKTLQAEVDDKNITIETDGLVDVTIDPDTRTIRISLSDEFKKSLVYRKEDAPDTV